jgi:phospholipase C
MHKREALKGFVATLLLSTMTFSPANGWAGPNDNHGDYESTIKKIKHIVVIYQENWSFDSLYGDFPGANGFDNASAQSLNQVDRLGKSYSAQLGANNFNRISAAAPQLSTPPQPINTNVTPAVIDSRFLNGAGNLIPDIGDNFFHSAFGGSFLNHQFLIAAAAPVFPNAAMVTPDQWGPGARVPAIFIGAMVKKGYIDHTQYETTSILSLIEQRFELKPLSTRDAQANPLTNIFMRK